MIALLSLFPILSAALADLAVEELCTAGDCGAAVQSHSLLQQQRKYVSSANTQPTEEKADAVKIDAPPCEGVESDGRCWYLSEQGENCEAACLKHGRSFKFKAPTKGKPIIPMLLKKEPEKEDGPWRAFECYKPDEDHLSLVSSCSANDYRDNQGSWSDPSCQLACPCGGVKECSWKQPEACTPVFQYKDNQHTGCIKVDSDKPWCSHDHDKTDEWSACVYTCTDAATGGSIEMFSEPPPDQPEDIELTLLLHCADSRNTPDAVFLKSEDSMPSYAANLDFKDLKEAMRSDAQKSESGAQLSGEFDEKDNVLASAPLGPVGKPMDGVETSIEKTVGSVTAGKEEITGPKIESGLKEHDSSSDILTKESQNIKPVAHATVGLDSDGDSLFSEDLDEPTSGDTSGEPVQAHKEGKIEKPAISTHDDTLKAILAPKTDLLKEEVLAPKRDDAMHEDNSKTTELKKGDSVNYAALGAQQGTNGTESKDESSESHEVVEQHNQLSDPHEKEEKSEKKEEKDTDKDDKDKEGKKESKKDSDKSDKNSTTDDEGSSEKSDSCRPGTFLLSMLTSALILGHVFVEMK